MGSTFILSLDLFQAHIEILNITCSSKTRLSHVVSVVHRPHEPVNELLLLGGSVVHHGDGDGGGVILVVGQPKPVQPVRQLLRVQAAVQLLQTPEQLRFCTQLSLGPLNIKKKVSVAENMRK